MGSENPTNREIEAFGVISNPDTPIVSNSNNIKPDFSQSSLVTGGAES
ncbi:hypothetical protein [Brasilonema sp. UFV-L1]|nr:hypothetical protein [Brasilonema sp. UFV-L1]